MASLYNYAKNGVEVIAYCINLYLIFLCSFLCPFSHNFFNIVLCCLHIFYILLKAKFDFVSHTEVQVRGFWSSEFFYLVSMGLISYYVFSKCIGGIFDQTSWRTKARRRKTWKPKPCYSFHSWRCCSNYWHEPGAYNCSFSHTRTSSYFCDNSSSYVGVFVSNWVQRIS